MKRHVALGGWLVAVAAATAILHAAGGGALAPPPLTRPHGWLPWAAQREPLVAAMAVLRLLALLTAWYLLVTAVLGVLLRLVRAARLVAVVDTLTLPAVRRLLVSAAGVTLASGGLTPSLACASPKLPAAVARPAPSQAAAAGQPVVTTTQGDPVSAPPTLTMRLLSPDAPSPPPPTPVAPWAPSAPEPPRSGPSGELATWRVQPGECFWSIADDVLTQARGRTPSEAEVVPYWRLLIEANRSALADRDNADLVFPGQVFTLPAVPEG
jgi:hypothetical protein